MFWREGNKELINERKKQRKVKESEKYTGERREGGNDIKWLNNKKSR
jgi:hypothetical protein